MPGKVTAYKKIAKSVVDRCIASNTDVVKCILALFKDSFVSSKLKERGQDYECALEITKNIKRTLKSIRYVDRYNGARKAVMAACVGKHLGRSAHLLGVHRNTLSQAVKWQKEWSTKEGQSLLKRTTLVKCRKSVGLPKFIYDWITENCTPSSNTKETKWIVEDGERKQHQTYWRTEPVDHLFERCRLAVADKFDGETFQRSYFYKCIPKFVRKKKRQEGLCPQHHTGYAMHKELLRKRNFWHKDCKCDCRYCSATGCAHGKRPVSGDCSRFSCVRCKWVRCRHDWSSIRTNWCHPIQKTRLGGGLYWYDEEHVGTRAQFMDTARAEMLAFNKHQAHVDHHRDQKARLFEYFGTTDVIIQTDFIQNISHIRGRETSQSYYGKRQTQFLSFVIWYWIAVDGVFEKRKLHVDYLSNYLNHNSLYFQKCLTHLLTYLRDDIEINFKKVWMLSDGGRAHFKSRISFFFMTTLPDLFGMCLFSCGSVNNFQDAVFHWLFSPSNHGKGECDSHGAVVKRGIRLFVLDDRHHVDDEDEAASYVNLYVKNSTAFVMQMTRDDEEQDCGPVQGSNSMHEFRFCGNEGELLVHTLPCLCTSCMAEEFDECEQKQKVGIFQDRVMQKKGTRVPKMRYEEYSREVRDGRRTFTVREIIESQYIEGIYQYKVIWEGFEDSTWVDVDRLTCIDLIEKFEGTIPPE